MLFAWPWELYGRMQSTQGLLRQVRRTAATQRIIPLQLKNKLVKTVHFDGTAEEVNRITARDTPIPRKKRKIFHAKKTKSDKDTVVTEEKERTYGIDRLNLGDPAVKLVNDSE